MTHVTNFKTPRPTEAERLAGHRKPVGYRQPVRRTNASNSSDLALAKGPTRADEKTARHAHETAVIKAVRADLWERSSVCELCGDTERQSAAKYPKATHEMHEDPPRSATRGLPAEERFNLRICLRVCPGCHRDYGVHVRALPLTTTEGFDGAYDVQRKNAAGEWETIATYDRKRGLRA